MTKGLGSDIIEIERIRKSIDRYGLHFLNRIFTEKEKTYCLSHQDPAPYFAARFAAKEAVSKALGTGIGSSLSWLDIEISHDLLGKPMATLSEKANHHFDFPKLLLSLTHSKEYAFAVAIFL